MSAKTLGTVASVVFPVAAIGSFAANKASGGQLARGTGANALDPTGGGNAAGDAQKRLEEERRAQLAQEAAARAAAADKAANRGSSVGRGAMGATPMIGFGTPASAPGLGRGALFGN